MTLICLIKSNEEQRTVAKAEATGQVIDATAADYYFEFTFSELRKVEQVLHVEVSTSPATGHLAGFPQDKKYGIADGLAADNIVGMTLHLDPVVGTTITPECVAVGF